MHKQYTVKLSEALTLQKKCLSGVQHQKYRLKAIDRMVKSTSKTVVAAGSEDEEEDKDDLEKDMLRRRAQLEQVRRHPY